MKPLKINGTTIAHITEVDEGLKYINLQVPYGWLKPRECRRLAAWLEQAADLVAKNNHRFNWRRRKKSGPLPDQLSLFRSAPGYIKVNWIERPHPTYEVGKGGGGGRTNG